MREDDDEENEAKADRLVVAYEFGRMGIIEDGSTDVVTVMTVGAPFEPYKVVCSVVESMLIVPDGIVEFKGMIVDGGTAVEMSNVVSGPLVPYMVVRSVVGMNVAAVQAVVGLGVVNGTVVVYEPPLDT